MEKRPRGAFQTPACGPKPFENQRLGVLFECPSGAAVSTEGMHCPDGLGWDPPMGGALSSGGSSGGGHT